MNFNPDKLVKNLSDEDFKYLVKEFGSKSLRLLKQNSAYPYEYMNCFKKFNEKNYLLENIFLALQKKEKLVMMLQYQTVKIWDKFDINDMGDYHDHYFKKEALLLADVFEKFINTCLKFYGFGPCH